MEEIKRTENELNEPDDGYTPLTQEELEEFHNWEVKRFTEDYLFDNEDVQENFREWFLKVFEEWRTTGADEAEINFVLDKMPTEWIAETYFNRYKYLAWDDDEDRYLFSEHIILPYCIKKGILVKKKGAKDYVYVEDKYGQMPELDFKD